MGKKKEIEQCSKNPLMTKEPIPGVTLVVTQKCLSKALLARILEECNTPHFYHKFIIRDIQGSHRNHILKTILDFVYPASFKALHFEIIGGRAYFLARNCQEAILKIISTQFCIPNPESNIPFKAMIFCNYILTDEVPIIDSSEVILKVLHKRFDKKTRTMNLNQFSDDEDLNDYFPLSQTKFLSILMTQIAELAPLHILLQNNGIREIPSFHPMNNYVQSIDLSCNELEDVSSLLPLCSCKHLTHLKLSGNPLCADYESYNYVLDVTRYCRRLEYLDGIDITTPVFQKNFLCSSYAEDFASQFLEHFFTVYDSDNRENLEGLYEQNSLLSINSKIVPNQSSSHPENFQHYGLRQPYLVKGVQDIINVFKEFPKSYHDPYPMVCDVVFFTATKSAIVVTGIFRENSQVMSFSRHFMFNRNFDEFRITNEQLHVSNVLDSQFSWSFRFPTHIGSGSSPLPYFQEQYRELEEVVHRITNMNYEYSQKYLDLCQYDLKETLILFCQKHTSGEIPQEAFSKERTRFNTLRPGDLPFSNRVREKTYQKHKSITLKSIWDTYNNERIAACKDPKYNTNPRIRRIYPKIEIPFMKSHGPDQPPDQPMIIHPVQNQPSQPGPSLVNVDPKSSQAGSLKTNSKLSFKLDLTNSKKNSNKTKTPNDIKNKGTSSASTRESIAKKSDNPMLRLAEKIEKCKALAAQKADESKKEEPPAKLAKTEEIPPASKSLRITPEDSMKLPDLIKQCHPIQQVNPLHRFSVHQGQPGQSTYPQKQQGHMIQPLIPKMPPGRPTFSANSQDIPKPSVKSSNVSTLSQPQTNQNMKESRWDPQSPGSSKMSDSTAGNSSMKIEGVSSPSKASASSTANIVPIEKMSLDSVEVYVTPSPHKTKKRRPGMVERFHIKQQKILECALASLKENLIEQINNDLNKEISARKISPIERQNKGIDLDAEELLLKNTSQVEWDRLIENLEKEENSKEVVMLD